MSDYFRAPAEEWLLHVEGNLGFAWSEDRKEMRVVLLIDGCQSYESATPSKSARPERIRTARRSSAGRRRRAQSARTRAAAKTRKEIRAEQKTARAEIRAAKAEKMARIMKEQV